MAKHKQLLKYMDLIENVLVETCFTENKDGWVDFPSDIAKVLKKIRTFPDVKKMLEISKDGAKARATAAIKKEVIKAQADELKDAIKPTRKSVPDYKESHLYLLEILATTIIKDDIADGGWHSMPPFFFANAKDNLADDPGLFELDEENLRARPTKLGWLVYAKMKIK